MLFHDEAQGQNDEEKITENCQQKPIESETQFIVAHAKSVVCLWLGQAPRDIHKPVPREGLELFKLP